MNALFLVVISGIGLHLHAATASWPQFRGPNGSGVAESDRPPARFGPETNLIWKIAMPSGLSSPCLGGDRIFLTAFENQKLFALCLRRRDGAELWRRESPPGKTQEVHQVSSPAVATPVTDGARVFVYFAPYGLVAYDLDGNEQWRKAIPIGTVVNGSGTSPAMVGGAVVVNCDQDEGESFILAVEAGTGKTRWQTSRAGSIGSYSTPVAWKAGAEEDVVVCGSLRVAGYEARTGRERWTARVLTSVGVASSPVVGDGLLYVMSRGTPPNAMGSFADFLARSDKDGDGRISPAEAPPGFQGALFRAIDHDKDGFITDKDWTAMMELFGKGDSGLFALRAPAAGDITSTHVAWKQTRGIAGISSPLFYRDRVYVVQDGGRLTCWEARTGKPLYEQERLGAEGEYYASPIGADGHIYLASARGTVTTIRAGDALDVEARNELGESIMATPAIADDRIYVRSAGHLWAFGRR